MGDLTRPARQKIGIFQLSSVLLPVTVSCPKPHRGTNYVANEGVRSMNMLRWSPYGAFNNAHRGVTCTSINACDVLLLPLAGVMGSSHPPGKG
jgi:hypothetical protein